MQKGIDSRIQARVRILLARRWIDLQSVTIGTTNGVVYLGGNLRTAGGPGDTLPGAQAGNPGAWLNRIRKEISEIAEVRDVVFQLQNMEETGDGWRQKSA